ncbi:MAG: helix-turn-helix domain-containing protein [Fuerstiella sp.]
MSKRFEPRKYTPRDVGHRFGVNPATVIVWCESGLMPAVNVARPGATRQRWRMSEQDIAVFQQRRENGQAVQS